MTAQPQVSSPLNVAVVGAGAVGCYFGGMLARAGHVVTLVARPLHVDAIKVNGLRMQTLGFDEQVTVVASSEMSAVTGADLVLFAVKSPDTEATASALRPYLKPDAVVLSLQNGVDNAERLRAVLTNEVLATVVYVATEMAGPGHVRHHGRGDLVMEPGLHGAVLADAFRAAGVPIELSDNVRGALWTKLVVNCAYNALSAISQLPYGRFITGEGVNKVIADLMDECLAVAQAEGVQLVGDARVAAARVAESMPQQYSSTAQDLARGKPTEIDYLNGLIVRRGEALGIATPVNRTVWSLVKLLERKAEPSA